jgi:DNA-binding FadR family transcriptional regulator
MQVVKAPDLDLRELVVEQLLGFIRSSELKPGGRLPPEPELAQTFGVSRTVVREAIKSLQATGVLNIEQGRGTFVAEYPFAQPLTVLSRLNRHRIDELFEVRLILEGESAFYAASARTNAQLRDVAAALEAAAVHADREEWQEAMEDDRQFHRSVARATGLKLVQEMLEVASPVWVEMNSQFPEEQDRRARLALGQAEHQAIYDAVKAGDGVAARGAMHRHLRASRQRRALYERRNELKE